MKTESITLRFLVLMHDGKKLFRLLGYDDIRLFLDDIDASWFDAGKGRDRFVITRDRRAPIKGKIMFSDGTDDTSESFDFSTARADWFKPKEVRVGDLYAEEFEIGDVIEVATNEHPTVDDFVVHAVKYTIVMLQRADKLHGIVRESFGQPTSEFKNRLLGYLEESGAGKTLVLV